MEEQIITEQKQIKLSKESAEAVFNEFLDFYDIDFEDIVNDQGKEGAKTLQNKMIRAIQKGKVEIKMVEENGGERLHVVQNLIGGDCVAYKEYNAAASMEADKGRGGATANYYLLASLCGHGVDRIKKLRGPDLKIAEYIGILYQL